MHTGLCDETLFPVVSALAGGRLVVGVVGAPEHAFVQVVAESPGVIAGQTALSGLEDGGVASGEIALGAPSDLGAAGAGRPVLAQVFDVREVDVDGGLVVAGGVAHEASVNLGAGSWC